MSTDAPGLDPVAVARNAQGDAINPRTNAWVSASAGSGKTTVLTSRVLALMLEGAAPERILCLTFTKAAAAEMANRIADRLGDWVTCEDDALLRELDALLGRSAGPAHLTRARRLFARVLEAPGGMRIETIHAFCQSLLRRFPIEAGLSPQFELMDDRTAEEALEETRDGVIAGCDGGHDPDLSRAMAYITGRLHETRFPQIVNEITRQRARLDEFFARSGGGDQGLAGAVDAVYRHLGLERAETRESIISAACAEASFDSAGLRAACAGLSRGSKADQERSAGIAAWIDARDRRIDAFEKYLAHYLTQEGAPRKTLATKAVAEANPAVVVALQAEATRLEALHDRLARVATAEATSALLCLAERLLRAYRGYKYRRSLLDFDDLIQTTRRLLLTPGMAEWVLYKLDGGLDHILIDEAQDTNPEQWTIVTALAEEFFAGSGRYAARATAEAPARTIFAVGDGKQSIYSFQGADVGGFERQRVAFGARVRSADGPWADVQMNVSFRSTEAVLKAVDLVFTAPEARDGVSGEPTAHLAARSGQAGRVEIWPPVVPEATDDPPPWKPPVERVPGDAPPNRLAGLIARRIAAMVRDQERLPSRGRAIRPGDVMVLVRRRSAFVDELVRQLKALNIAVAGVDRMVLPQQLAVMDLIALGHFLLLPQDDLTLATVLKSPLIGLTEDQLFALAHPRGEASLWEALAAHGGAASDYGVAHKVLADLLARTDYLTPFALFSHVVVNRDGRRRALGRLGLDADDPIDEFLALALAYERSHPPSLQSFLQWVERGEIEIKRDLEQGGGDAVRIMTVHGAKGLQAPIVFLPDTLQVPKDLDALHWTAGAEPVLLWVPSSKVADTLSAGLREAAKARQMQEYRRLLYVAMTRAEDRLYVCGWETKNKPAGHWYGLISEGLRDLARPADDPFLAGEGVTVSAEIRVLENEQAAAPTPDAEKDEAGAAITAVPAWASAPAPPERDPPRPLAPSRASAEPAVISPLAEDTQLRFQRGLIIHRLLQTLPEVPRERRRPAAERFTAQSAWRLSREQRSAIVDETLAVLEAKAFADLFGPGSLAEVPVVGLVGRHAVSGQVDRLAVTGKEVWIVDYKTNRPPPRAVADVDAGYVFQMAVYRDILRRIYPGREVRCVLLWTDGPFTMEVPATMMDAAVSSAAA